MTSGAVLLVAAIALFSYASAAAVCRHSTRLGLTDAPNDRSLHSTCTPRAGGVGFAFLAPVAIAWQMAGRGGGLSAPELTLLVAASSLAAVSLADDRWGLPVSVRLVAQIGAAIAVVAAGGLIREIQLPWGSVYQLGVAAVPLTLLWLIGLTNIYNFMDGIDGLAGVQAIVAAGVMGFLASCAGSSALAASMAILAGGVLGFLPLNWSPARIFMGDVGSTFLGFMFGGWAVLTGGTSSGPLPLFAWAAVLSPFLFDASVTLLARLLRGERLHHAHRDHIYQQLVRRGWSHQRTTLLYGALACGAGVLTLLHYCVQLLSGAAYAALVLSAVAITLLGAQYWPVLSRRGA